MKKTDVIYKWVLCISVAYLLFLGCYIVMGVHYWGMEVFKIKYTRSYGIQPYCYSVWLSGSNNISWYLTLCSVVAGLYSFAKVKHEWISEVSANSIDYRPTFRFWDLAAVVVVSLIVAGGGWLISWQLFGAMLVVSVIGYFVVKEIFYLWKQNRWKEHSFFLHMKKNFEGIRWILLFGGTLIMVHAVLSIRQQYFYGSLRPYEAFLSWCLPIVDLIFFCALCICFADWDVIKRRIKKMSEGNFDEDAREVGAFGRQTMQHLNDLNNGMKTAVEERIKSERLKTELITNVSHDLKTPLTSVVNYVQLLKREPMASEPAARYLDVLEQKTEQMRTLTEDIIELSRLMSNNVPVEKTELNFSEMVRQANGEFAESFESRGLEVRCTLPEEDCVFELDGQKTWRVLENLYTNVRKYAMGFSRVYVDVKEMPGAVHFTMKNVSQAELSQSPEELMERFVRGDQSRTTEGSGLGLSIAKSLVEIQGGSFEIEISGDLFVAKVKLPR